MGYCGYSRVLEVLWGTGGYGGTGGTVWYLGVRGYLGVNRVVVNSLRYCGVLCGTVGVLHGTAGYCWLLLGTGWYWGVLGGTGVH